MDDWRLNGQEVYLSGKTLYRITFPAFWDRAYREKNAFFRKVEQTALRHVKATNRGHEYLEGENVQRFWHDHCEFCWEKVMTDKDCTFYCTEDLQYWICEECFRDFRNRFHWLEKSAEDLDLSNQY